MVGGPCFTSNRASLAQDVEIQSIASFAIAFMVKTFEIKPMMELIEVEHATKQDQAGINYELTMLVKYDRSTNQTCKASVFQSLPAVAGSVNAPYQMKAMICNSEVATTEPPSARSRTTEPTTRK